MNTKRIFSVSVVRDIDIDPDLSWIGKYSAEPEPNAIDRKENGDMGRGEYRYFIPTMTGDETGNPDSPQQDYYRMEGYNKGDWWMVGIHARAEVVISGHTIQTIRSGGLWGIESDSDSAHFEEVEKEQLAELAEQLQAVGFTTEEIQSAIAKRGAA